MKIDSTSRIKINVAVNTGEGSQIRDYDVPYCILRSAITDQCSDLLTFFKIDSPFHVDNRKHKKLVCFFESFGRHGVGVRR